jgi:Protein of unknown function (DUF2752)
VTLTVPPRGRTARLPRAIGGAGVAGGVAARYLGLAVGAAVLGAVHLHHRPATICPFRALTGLPCPFCGGTTAAVHLGHADVRGALAASPLAVAMLIALPLVGVVRPPSWWHRRRWRVAAIVTVLVAAELWQLVRFGVL